MLGHGKYSKITLAGLLTSNLICVSRIQKIMSGVALNGSSKIIQWQNLELAPDKLSGS